jgi:Fumarate reductase flavoprotein C-term
MRSGRLGPVGSGAGGTAARASRAERIARPHDYPDRDDDSYLRHTLVSLADGRPLDWKPVRLSKWQPQARTCSCGARGGSAQHCPTDPGLPISVASRTTSG